MGRKAWKNKAREKKIEYRRFVKSAYRSTGKWYYPSKMSYRALRLIYQKNGRYATSAELDRMQEQIRQAMTNIGKTLSVGLIPALENMQQSCMRVSRAMGMGGGPFGGLLGGLLGSVSHMNVLGTQSGRFDSSKPNRSNSPSYATDRIDLDEIEHWKLERPIKTFEVQSMIDLKFKWSDFARIFTEFSSLDGDYITITADSTFHLGNDVEDFSMRGDVEGHDLITTHPDEVFVTLTRIFYGGNGKGTWESERLIPLLSCSTGTILYQVKYKDGDVVQYRFIDGDLKVLPHAKTD